MGNVVFGVLLDTVSIQRYIFSTNNLKENIGASYIVKDIFESHLKEVIKEIFPSINDNFYTTWKENPGTIAIKENWVLFEIGYIGGGNALLLFREENKAKGFIKEWTLRLLVKAPGLIPACYVDKIDLDNFSEGLRNLFKKLSENKSRFVPQTIIKRHGVTAECPCTGYSAEIWCNKLSSEEQNYISSVSNAKIMASGKANKKLEDMLTCWNLNSKYAFTDELERLGQSKGEDSHIAIVHIDGNDMGERFRKQNNLSELRKLSISVENVTIKSFNNMLLKIDEKINEIKKEDIKLEEYNGKTILPLRPIVIGGDDITFVSEGRLGIWLAKVFLEAFEKQKVSDDKPLSACAGVAITKTKYPFYRGYKLSEDLTRSAKDDRKKAKDNGSWIDFHIAYGGFSGSLEDIRNNYYKTPQVKSLLLRPYKITDFDETLKCVAKLKEKIKGKPVYPHSKLMELRQVLYMEESTQELFLKELKARGLNLPQYKNFNGEKIIVNMETPYFDMIELLDLYPEFALPNGRVE
jgi:hypothetical protein